LGIAFVRYGYMGRDVDEKMCTGKKKFYLSPFRQEAWHSRARRGWAMLGPWAGLKSWLDRLTAKRGARMEFWEHSKGFNGSTWGCQEKKKDKKTQSKMRSPRISFKHIIWIWYPRCLRCNSWLYMVIHILWLNHQCYMLVIFLHHSPLVWVGLVFQNSRTVCGIRRRPANGSLTGCLCRSRMAPHEWAVQRMPRTCRVPDTDTEGARK